MAVRFRSEQVAISGREFKIEISDSEHVGSVTEFTTDARGFELSYQGNGIDNLHPIITSRLTLGMVIENATQAALITDLATAPENRFTVQIFEIISSSDVPFWVGYIFFDNTREQDLTYPFILELSAIDGLSRLKKVEFKQGTGVTSEPRDIDNFIEHLCFCLRQNTELVDNYFGDGVNFLATIVNWYDTNHSTVTEAKDPLRYSRIDPVIFSQRRSDGQWTFKSCYDILNLIAEHWCARIMMSGGRYRFEQINERSESTYVERRYDRDGDFLTADTIASYELDVDQTSIIAGGNGSRLASGVFGFLPPLRDVDITYDHFTYKNYLDNYNNRWAYNTAGGSITISNLKFDADSYIEVTGRIYLKLTGPTTTQFRHIFAMVLTVGGEYFKKRSYFVPNQYLITYDEPGEWVVGFQQADISTNYIWGGSFDGYIDFALRTTEVPSGADSIIINFVEDGAEDNAGGAVADTIIHYSFKNLTLRIAGTEDDTNYYTKSLLYKWTNFTTGNTDTIEQTHLFGNPIKPWTRGRIQTTSNLVTWNDTTQSWGVGAAGTQDFGSLAAKQIMASRNTALRTYSGTIYCKLMRAHTRPTLTDGNGYLLLSATYTSNLDQWSGDWWAAGVGVDGEVIVGEETDIPDDDADFVGTKPPAVYGGGAVLSGVNSGSNIALQALAVNYTDADISAGAVTSIGLQFAASESAYLIDDDIALVNPQTGMIAPLTVTTASSGGDTTLAVTGTLTQAFPKGSYLIYSALNKFTGQGGPALNLPVGTAQGQIMLWDDVNEIWEPYSGATDGHVLTWDTVNGWQAEAAGAGSGTVTSVALSLPTAIFDVSGSPVTTSGTLTATLDNQSANTVFAGPTTGAATTPGFRVLVSEDIPVLDTSKLTTGTLPIARGGTGLSALGTDGQLLRVNTGATALEYFTPAYLTTNQTITLSGDVTGSGTTAITTTIAANAVTDAKFRQSAGLSVVGRSANTTGNVADITAGTDAHVLRRSGTTIGFGQVATGGITDAAVTYAKIQNVSATNRLLGRITAGAGVVEELTAAQAQTILGFLDGTLTATRIPFASDANTLTDDLEFRWDNTNKRLSVGDTGGSPQAKLHIAAGAGTTFEGLRLASNSSNGQYFNISNANNTSGGSSYGIISVGGTSAGDPFMRFTVSGGISWSAGVDNSDADKFRLKPTADPSNTANKGITITNDTINRIGINKDAPAYEIDNPNTTRSQMFINTGNLWSTSNVALGTGNGTSGSVSSVSGGTNFYQITWNSGTGPVNNGDILTITFPVAFPTITYTVFSARSAGAATDISKMYAVTNTATQCVIRANGTITASTTFSLAFHTGTYSAV